MTSIHRRDHDERQEDDRVYQDVQTEIDETVGGDTDDSEYRSEPERARVTRVVQKIRARGANHLDCEPNADRKPNDPAARK
jgi:hypothetical protein